MLHSEYAVELMQRFDVDVERFDWLWLWILVYSFSPKDDTKKGLLQTSFFPLPFQNICQHDKSLCLENKSDCREYINQEPFTIINGKKAVCLNFHLKKVWL